MKARSYIAILLATAVVNSPWALPTTVAQPGATVAVVTVPVASPSCCGIGIAVDCEDPANLYYTNTFSPILHKMDSTGVDLGSVAITDAAGASISFGAIAWDDTRKVLWGGTDSSGNPLSVYQIDPLTGIATFQFTAMSAGCCGFCDGIAYDASDDTVYVSDDVSTVIDQHSASTGAWIRTLTPKNAAGGNLGAISGVMVGKGDLLYLGRNGFGQIVQVKKSDGSFIGSFASPGGRDEDLECDVVSFAPLTVIWSKDAYNNTVTAIEVEEGTCLCGGGEGGCVRTQGYWKNHRDEWPVDGLTLGMVNYDQGQLLDILHEKVKGNGLISLSHQLIAARLNHASGAPLPQEVQEAMAAADSMIGGLVVPPIGDGSLDPDDTGPVTDMLDEYNNGEFPDGPVSCDELEDDEDDGELPPCEGEPLSCSDLNGDGLVDACDLLLLLGAWGPCNGSCPADCDGNGAVGANDLLVLLVNWTGGAPAGILACIDQFNPDGELEALIACVEPFCNCE